MPEENIEEAAVEIEESRVSKTIEKKIEQEKEILESKAAISLPMTGATEAWMDDDDNFGGFSSSDDDQGDEDKMPEENIEKIEAEKEVLKSKVALSLPMTGATEAWMDEDDKFDGFSSSDDDQVNEDEMLKAMPEENVKKEAAVEIEESAEILKSKAAISLPMTGATEAWMDDDENFGGFSSSDDDQVAEDEIANKMSEEKIKQEAAVEVEESAEIKAIAEKIEPEKEDDDNFDGFSSSDDDQIA